MQSEWNPSFQLSRKSYLIADTSTISPGVDTDGCYPGEDSDLALEHFSSLETTSAGNAFGWIESQPHVSDSETNVLDLYNVEFNDNSSGNHSDLQTNNLGSYRSGDDILSTEDSLQFIGNCRIPPCPSLLRITSWDLSTISTESHRYWDQSLAPEVKAVLSAEDDRIPIWLGLIPPDPTASLLQNDKAEIVADLESKPKLARGTDSTEISDYEYYHRVGQEETRTYYTTFAGKTAIRLEEKPIGCDGGAKEPDREWPDKVRVLPDSGFVKCLVCFRKFKSEHWIIHSRTTQHHKREFIRREGNETDRPKSFAGDARQKTLSKIRRVRILNQAIRALKELADKEEAGQKGSDYDSSCPLQIGTVSSNLATHSKEGFDDKLLGWDPQFDGRRGHSPSTWLRPIPENDERLDEYEKLSQSIKESILKRTLLGNFSFSLLKLVQVERGARNTTASERVVVYFILEEDDTELKETLNARCKRYGFLTHFYISPRGKQLDFLSGKAGCDGSTLLNENTELEGDGLDGKFPIEANEDVEEETALENYHPISLFLSMKRQVGSGIKVEHYGSIGAFVEEKTDGSDPYRYMLSCSHPFKVDAPQPADDVYSVEDAQSLKKALEQRFKDKRHHMQEILKVKSALEKMELTDGVEENEALFLSLLHRTEFLVEKGKRIHKELDSSEDKKAFFKVGTFFEKMGNRSEIDGLIQRRSTQEVQGSEPKPFYDCIDWALIRVTVENGFESNTLCRIQGPECRHITLKEEELPVLREKKSRTVMKKGARTGWTDGLLNATKRTTCWEGGYREDFEVVSFMDDLDGKNRASVRPFADRGDSGSMVCDEDGRVIGLLWGGRADLQITAVQPFRNVKRQIKKYLGMDVRLIKSDVPSWHECYNGDSGVGEIAIPSELARAVVPESTPVGIAGEITPLDHCESIPGVDVPIFPPTFEDALKESLVPDLGATKASESACEPQFIQSLGLSYDAIINPSQESLSIDAIPELTPSNNTPRSSPDPAKTVFTPTSLTSFNSSQSSIKQVGNFLPKGSSVLERSPSKKPLQEILLDPGKATDEQLYSKRTLSISGQGYEHGKHSRKRTKVGI